MRSEFPVSFEQQQDNREAAGAHAVGGGPPNRATRRRILRQLRREVRAAAVRPEPEPFAWIERLSAKQHLERLMEERAPIQRHLGREPEAA